MDVILYMQIIFQGEIDVILSINIKLEYREMFNF